MLPQNFISSPTSSEKPETSVCLGRQRRKVSAYHAWPPPWGRLGQLEDQYGQERISQSFRALVTLRRPRILEDFCHEGDINKSLFPCPISVGKRNPLYTQMSFLPPSKRPGLVPYPALCVMPVRSDSTSFPRPPVDCFDRNWETVMQTSRSSDDLYNMIFA